MITQSTYSPSNPERVADWYTKAVYSGYPLMTGMRRDPSYEYARTEMLDAAPIDNTPWQSYGDLSHGF